MIEGAAHPRVHLVLTWRSPRGMDLMPVLVSSFNKLPFSIIHDNVGPSLS